MTMTAIKTSKNHADRIAKVLYENLAQGKINIGDRLPSIRELGKTFNVQRETVRRAMESLANEGFLDMRAGSGTYVRAVPQDRIQKAWQILLWMPNPNVQYQPNLFKVFEHKPGQEYQFTVVSSRESLVRQDFSNYSGIIAVVPSHEDLDFVRRTAGEGFPIVSLSRSYIDIPVSSVIEDNFNAAYDLTRWLLGNGHRRIAFFGEYNDRRQSFLVGRLHGWKAALEEAGIDPSSQPAHFITHRENESIFSAMIPLFEKPDFEAIFCSMGVFLDESLRHIASKGIDMVAQRGVACIDTNGGNSGVAYASHDLQHLIDGALNMLDRPFGSVTVETVRVPMKLHFPQ